MPLVLLTLATTRPAVDAAEQAAMRQNFLWNLALPVMGLCLGGLIAGVLLANHVRRRKLRRGELPAWDEEAMR